MFFRIALAASFAVAIAHSQPIAGDSGLGAGDGANRQVYDIHRAEREKATGTRSASPDVVVLVGDTIVPQVVDGGGWKTTFKFVNLNNYPVTFKVLFFADNGTNLALPILGLGNNVINVTITLVVAGSIDVETAGTNSALSQGWAYVLQQSPTDSIGGFAIFRQRVPGIPDQEAAVPIVNQFDNHFALIYDNTDFVTAIAIANASPTSSVVIPVNIRDQGGNITSSQTISLGPDQHTAFVLSSLAPSTAGQQGVVEFLVSGLGVGALGLRFNGAAFTSFPVLSNFNWIVPPAGTSAAPPVAK